MQLPRQMQPIEKPTMLTWLRCPASISCGWLSLGAVGACTIVRPKLQLLLPARTCVLMWTWCPGRQEHVPVFVFMSVYMHVYACGVHVCVCALYVSVVLCLLYACIYTYMLYSLLKLLSVSV